MTSRQIAELTGKRHDNVMRDIRSMLALLHGERGVLTFEDTFKEISNGQEYPIFILPKNETLCLVAGYDVKARMAIIKRWQELEETQKPALPNFSDPAAAARAWAEQYEARTIAEQKNLLDAPKVEFAMAVRNMEGSCLLGVFCKTLTPTIGRNNFFEWLRQRGVLDDSNLPYQKYRDSGYFVVIEQFPFTDKQGKTHPTFTTHITGKGQVWIEKAYRSEYVGAK